MAAAPFKPQISKMILREPRACELTGDESCCDLLESAEIQSSATESRVYLHFMCTAISRTGRIKMMPSRTRRSQMGINMIKAKGSRFDNTSLGRP